MKVKITKPDSTVFEGEAKLLQLPGTGGLFEILQNHAPIISSLSKGTIRLVTNDDETKTFDIRGGVVKGQQNDILILVQ
ncbi:MAG: F0F1 ATP synthase subunit epsilon [Bacteroidales bacterium]|jgi:F-type H+-transporting ATPase subunit epsilon|nr:F0F1 ATP synthase subunit epsilon [Bacteroidales bacterium]MBR5352650.1 F0F1 ATP synthase subunit epsilon [Bacteroidales bacterium]